MTPPPPLRDATTTPRTRRADVGGFASEGDGWATNGMPRRANIADTADSMLEGRGGRKARYGPFVLI